MNGLKFEEILLGVAIGWALTPKQKPTVCNCGTTVQKKPLTTKPAISMKKPAQKVNFFLPPLKAK